MRERRIAWWAGAAATIAYLITRTRDVGGDDTVYAIAVERFLSDRAIELEFFQPHHLVYNPLVAVVTAGLRALGSSMPVLDVGAAVSAVAGGIAVGVWTRTAAATGIAPRLAALGAVLLAASGGLWAYATRMEVYALAAAALAVWLAVTASERPRPVASGLALAAAILGHAVLGVLAIPTAWRFRREPRSAARALGIGIGIPAAVTLAMLVFVRGARTPRAWLSVLFPAESAGFVEGGASPLGLLSALRRVVTWGWYRDVPVIPTGLATQLDLLGWAGLILAGLLFAAGAAAAIRSAGAATARLALVGLAAFLPVWVYWDAGNVEHVVAAAPLLAIVVATGAASLPRTGGLGALAVVAASLVVVNGLGCAWPQSRPENGRVWVTASFVAEKTPPDALILSAGTDARLRLGLGYLSGRRVADLTLAVRASVLRGEPATAGLDGWFARAAASRELRAMDDLFDPETEAWMSGLGIDVESWRRARGSFAREGFDELEPDGAVVVKPLRLYRVRAQ